jgi:hypothetical protein
VVEPQWYNLARFLVQFAAPKDYFPEKEVVVKCHSCNKDFKKGDKVLIVSKTFPSTGEMVLSYCCKCVKTPLKQGWKLIREHICGDV